VRKDSQRILVGALAGAILGVVAAVLLGRVQKSASNRAGAARSDAHPVTLQQAMSIAVQVVNVLRQLLSLA
jgi:gas vesicle protein